MCYIVCMKKNFFLFALTILLFEAVAVSPAFAHNGVDHAETGHAIAELERTMPAVDPATAPDLMVRPLRGEVNKMMILPYDASLTPASDSASPVLRRVSKQVQDRRDTRKQEREERRKQREEELKDMDKSERAQERMSDVAKRVQEILANREAKGGIGELVREVAREHSEGQATLSARLEKVESRRGALKWLFGNDRKTLLEIKKDATTIDQRIAKVEAELDSMSEEEREVALDLIEDLKAQRTELLATVEEKDSEFSVAGWFKKLFGQTN
jgi:hypothetical protein